MLLLAQALEDADDAQSKPAKEATAAAAAAAGSSGEGAAPGAQGAASASTAASDAASGVEGDTGDGDGKPAGDVSSSSPASPPSSSSSPSPAPVTSSASTATAPSAGADDGGETPAEPSPSEDVAAPASPEDSGKPSTADAASAPAAQAAGVACGREETMALELPDDNGQMVSCRAFNDRPICVLKLGQPTPAHRLRQNSRRSPSRGVVGTACCDVERVNRTVDELCPASFRAATACTLVPSVVFPCPSNPLPVRPYVRTFTRCACSCRR